MVIMKKMIILFALAILPVFLTDVTFAKTIDVLIKGMDNGVKTTRDHDYQEAVMNAKLQAIEQAGVSIKAISKVENFQLKYDMIESKAEAALLPGFQIIDMGYQKDGTYQVVLSGKVLVNDTQQEQSKLWGKLRCQPAEFSDFKEALELWKVLSAADTDNQYINNNDGTVSDLATGLMWAASYEIKENILEARQYIEQINKKKFAGFSDWRIPTLAEVASLLETKAAGKLDSGRESYLASIFTVKPYCWYLWSADRAPEGYLLAYIGEKRSSIAAAGDQYQSDGICVACLKAVRTIK
jgi:hypothetical protein